MNFGAVILAAGSSRRMGQPKLLLPWRNTTILGHLLELWQTAGARQLAVVCAGDNDALRAELDRLKFPARNRIVNPDPERGMFSSIQCAAQWTGWDAELTHHAIILGDQPHLRLETVRAVLDCAAAHAESISQPRFNGHRRHPVVLPKALFRLAASSTASDLKEFLQPHSAARVDFEATDTGLELDLDTPEDYARAQRLYLRDE